jgi:hypothetical protein
MPITVEFRMKHQNPNPKSREPRDLHAVIEIFNDQLHQILPTSEFAQMVECGEYLEFLQQSEVGVTRYRQREWVGHENREKNTLDAFLVFAQSPEHLQVSIRQSLSNPSF